MVEFRKLFRRKKLVNALKSLGALRLRVPHSSLVVASLLFIVLILAFVIRLLPMRWGTYLSEFDPYFQYRVTEHMVENGFFAWTSWHDDLRWYPYGHEIARTAFPGLPFTAASSYLVLDALGLPINLLEFVVLFPAIMGTLTCLVMYFLGKDIGGKEVGLFSALFLALNAAYIGRTSWGFFDDETVGIFGILLFILFFLRSIETEKPFKSSMIYAIAAGLSLGYIFISWGAAQYPMGMTVLFVFAMLLLRRYSSRLLFSYSTTFGIALFIAVNIPKNGFQFLTGSSVLPVFGVFLLLCIYEAVGYIKTAKMKALFVIIFVALLIFSFFMLSWLGFIKGLEAKYLSVLNPFERFTRPIMESVQEHRPAAWGSFYYDFGIGVFFVPFGLFFAVRNPTNRNVFLGIFGLTSIYFASSMIRLTLLMAPALCLLWALALVRLLRPFITLLKESPIIPRRKTRFATRVGKEFSGAVLIVVFLLLLLTFVLPDPRVFGQADSPTTLASASVPIKPAETVTDWIDTLAWMRENLPSTAVVASWWDYGYWIAIWGNRTSLADNGTWNLTQIQNIGLMFMSNETGAIQILEKWNQDAHNRGLQSNVSHVLVFTTFDQNGNDAMVGDEGKWRWMARIPGLDDQSFGNYSLGTDWVDTSEDGSIQSDELLPNSKGSSTLLYKLMTYGKETKLGTSPSVSLGHFDLTYFSQGSAVGGIYPLVCIYEIKY
jgi:dolichyl-diphosphooligosaccharide--protein glycosyltransferase